jgi:hypothetical protein
LGGGRLRVGCAEMVQDPITDVVKFESKDNLTSAF